MSITEFRKLRKGERLHNETKHKAKTNSDGFCFFDYEDIKPEYAWEFMLGICSDDCICVVLETKKELKKSWGLYADPKYLPSLSEIVNMLFGNYENTKSIKVNEYCTNDYSIEDFKILKIGYPPIYSWEYEKWKWEKVKEEIN